MAGIWKRIVQAGIFLLADTSTNNDEIINLNAVASATNGLKVDVKLLSTSTISVNVSVNTGAVTVNIEQSNDGTTWYPLDSKTYTAVTGLDTFSFAEAEGFNFMRTTTTTQSDSTVTTTFTGRS